MSESLKPGDIVRLIGVPDPENPIRESIGTLGRVITREEAKIIDPERIHFMGSIVTPLVGRWKTVSSWDEEYPTVNWSDKYFEKL